MTLFGLAQRILFLLATLFVFVPSSAAEPVGGIATTQIESPHPYPRGDANRPIVWSRTLTHPGATFIKLHFARFALHPGSALRLRDAAGTLVAEYTEARNAKGSFWALSIPGDMATIELRADAAGTDHGVSIDEYGYGTVPIAKSTCGAPQTQDVACYANTPIFTESRAVGRMLFRQGQDFAACTGFLISPGDYFLSNEHCISSQAEVDSLEVRFNYQHSACGGEALESFETVAGDRFVLADAALDVALMTLEG